MSSNPALRLIKTLRISWQEMVSNLSITPATPKRIEESARLALLKMADAISLRRCKRTKEKREKKGEGRGILEGISDFKRCRGELEPRSTAYQNTKDVLAGNGI